MGFQAKIIIFMVIFSLLSAAIGGAYWYYNWSQKEIQILRDNNLKLELSLEEQKEAVKQMKRDVKNHNNQIIIVNKKFQEARDENISLRKKLSDHDIGFLASKKPKAIQRIVNRGTRDVGRCFEILSGAPLTEKEKHATKKSHFNSSCPKIANPQYRP